MDNLKIGKTGEDIVADYLRKQGFIVLRQNFKGRFGEIDVIAESETHIIFVEVKTRTGIKFATGREAVDRSKQNRIKATAADFLSKFPMELQPRFDVAEITATEAGRTFKYFKDAF